MRGAIQKVPSRNLLFVFWYPIGGFQSLVERCRITLGKGGRK